MSARSPINNKAKSPPAAAAAEKDMAPPVSGQSSSPSEAPPAPQPKAPVRAPAGFNDHYCYGLLTKADRQVTTKSEKNARNISRLAKTTANHDNRMRAQERRGIRG